MPISRIEVNEYECALCGYKWISRVNGIDQPIPRRCAKCKHQHWEKGHIGKTEKAARDAVKKRFGYFFYHHSGMSQGGWNIEKNAELYLEGRPAIDEMKILSKPMSYLYESKLGIRKNSKRGGVVPDFDSLRKSGKYLKYMHYNYQATIKAHEYEKQLSRQLLRDFMNQRDIPYDEREAKMQLLYSRHGKYAIPMMRLVPELCNALREDLYHGLTDEQIRNNKKALEKIKAEILKEQSEELRYSVDSPEELIQSCWPDWLGLV